MKLLLIFSFVVFVASQHCPTTGPSFLKHIGNYENANQEVEKEYYLSQKIKYTWLGAYMFCKNIGMKLANISEKPGELNNFKSIVENTTEFNDSAFVDLGGNYDDPLKCYQFRKYKHSSIESLYLQHDCDYLKASFVCENITREVKFRTSDITGHHTKLSVREKFFKPIGSYINEHCQKRKSFFMSVNVQTPPDQAIKYCQSMNMKLAAPQDQSEFNNLVTNLENVQFEWQNAAIAGYLGDENVWSDSGKELNYDITWGQGEPNNLKGDESCLFMQSKNGISVNDDPCSAYSFPFICEYDHGLMSSVREDKEETSRFLRTLSLVIVDNEQTQKELYVSHVTLKVSWVEASSMCKSLGMEIFTPGSKDEFEQVVDKLRSSQSVKSVHLGITKVGSSKWYSVNSGKDVAYKTVNIDQSKDQDDFLMLKNVDNDFIFKDAQKSETANFICQKLIESELTNAIN